MISEFYSEVTLFLVNLYLFLTYFVEWANLNVSNCFLQTPKVYPYDNLRAELGDRPF